MSKFQYWGGSTVYGGEIRPLDAIGFPAFCQRYIDIAHPINITREDYFARSKKEQSRLKDGSYFTPCSFAEGVTFRNDDNAEFLVLACFDLDNPDDARPFVESPDALNHALHPFAYTAYTTASSTKENPRLRVVVETEPMDLDRHAEVITTLARMLGLKDQFEGRRESTVKSQPMYRPVVFKGDDFSPVIGSNTHGKRFLEGDIDEDAVIEQEAHKFGNCPELGEDSDLLDLPIAGVDVEEVREPLMAIDPDCDYKTWVETCCALRHQFRGDEEQDAFEIFDEWSSGGSKYDDSNTTYRKWRSFEPSKRTKYPITIRSLFHYAEKHGWSPLKLSTKVNESITAWMESTEDAHQLMQDGPKRIAASPFTNEIVDESLVSALRNRIKTLGGTNVSKANVMKLVRKARKIEKGKGLSDKDNHPDWLRGWVYVAGNHVFRYCATGLELIPQAFDANFSRHLMPENADDDSAVGGRPPILPSNYALNLAQIVRVEGATYDPTAGKEFIEKNGRTLLNLYSPSSYPELDPSTKDECGEIVMRILGAQCPDPVLARLFLQWMAYNIIFPGAKIRWAMWLQGAQGSGKSMLGRMMAVAAGETNVKIINPGALASDFNDWMFGAHIGIIEEFKVHGHAALEVMNKIKELITNDTAALNRKFKDVQVEKLVMNALLLTNFHNGLSIDDTDRRYCVIKSAIQSREQVLDFTSTGVFAKAGQLMKDHPGGFRSFFMDVDLEGFPVNGPAPNTKFRDEMVRLSKHPLQEAIEDHIANPSYPLIAQDIIHFGNLVDNTQVEARNAYRHSHYLSEMGFIPYGEGRKFDVQGLRTAVWVHRDLYDEDLGEAVDTLNRLAQAETLSQLD